MCEVAVGGRGVSAMHKTTGDWGGGVHGLMCVRKGLAHEAAEGGGVFGLTCM